MHNMLWRQETSHLCYKDTWHRLPDSRIQRNVSVLHNVASMPAHCMFASHAYPSLLLSRAGSTYHVNVILDPCPVCLPPPSTYFDKILHCPGMLLYWRPRKQLSIACKVPLGSFQLCTKYHVRRWYEPRKSLALRISGSLKFPELSGDAKPCNHLLFLSHSQVEKLRVTTF